MGLTTADVFVACSKCKDALSGGIGEGSEMTSAFIARDVIKQSNLVRCDRCGGADFDTTQANRRVLGEQVALRLIHPGCDTKSTGILCPVHYYRGADRQAPMPNAEIQAFVEGFQKNLDPFFQQTGVGPNMAAETTCACCKTIHVRSLQKCSRCSSVRYCGRECQKTHWPAHKKECQRIADLRAREPAPPRSRIPVAEQLWMAMTDQQESEADVEREVEAMRLGPARQAEQAREVAGVHDGE
jgi:hypothetical protein